MLKSAKFSVTDLHQKLQERGWRGRYFGISNRITYLTDTNATLAVVEFDASRSVIVSVNFK
jgi:hypothetical protein